MSSQKHVQKLSATKQRLSLGEVKKQEKVKATSGSGNKFVRTTVLNPHELEWPDIEEKEEEDFLALLKSDLQCLKSSKVYIPLKAIQKVEKGKRAEFRRKYQAEHASQNAGSETRGDVCLGVNCVSTALEKDSLIGLIIEKNVDPPLITKLLIPPAKSKNIPVVAVTGLSKTCQESFKTRCIALGFKKICGQTDHALSRIVSTITSICSEEKKTTSDSDDQDIAKSENQIAPVSEGKKRKAVSSQKSQYIPPKLRKV